MTFCAESPGRSANGLSWMNMRAVFSAELPPVEPTKPTTPLDRRILLDDVGQLVGEIGHGVERDVLARLGLAEDEAGVLLGKKPLGMTT